MSLLAPLYVAGLLAISLPVVFHLIRRAPRGQLAFSSLMFLSVSPPRMTRRSRLDHLLLLLLRAIALGLLVFAFTRPFLREAALLDREEATGRRVAVLVDTSASMRRGDLWRQAVATVDDLLGDAEPSDRIAVFTFDETWRPVAGFEELARIESVSRRDLIAGRLQALTPGWSATHLGNALLEAVAVLNDVVDTTEQDSQIARRIVLVSDLQQGSSTDELGGFSWPANVDLEIRQLRPGESTNAGAHPLADQSSDRMESTREFHRVRVSNSPESKTDQFELAWFDADDSRAGDPWNVYVPAGESRVVRVPRPGGSQSPNELRLTGDDHDFDNRLFLIPQSQAEITVLYLGDEAVDDPRGHRYYLQRALEVSPAHRVEVVARRSREELPVDLLSAAASVVVVGDPLGRHVEPLRQYVHDGGILLVVVSDSGPAPSLGALLDVPTLEFAEADVDGYAMWSQIDFDHRLFAPLAAPRFNDFTNIHFWKHRRAVDGALEDHRVLARFDDGAPAWIEADIGDGQLHLLTAGWHSADSQLARSTKFVPLVSSLLTSAGTSRLDADVYRVNQRVPLIGRKRVPAELSMRKPDGAVVELPGGTEVVSDTDLPGIYRVDFGDESEQFAVNLSAAESNTAPLAAETLEQLGCRLAGADAKVVSDQQRRQMRDVELESRQKLWQWLILAALAALILETIVAGRFTRRSLSLTNNPTVTA